MIGKVYDEAMKDLTKYLESINSDKLEIMSIQATDEKMSEKKKALLEKQVKTILAMLEKKIVIEMNFMNEITNIFQKETKSAKLLERDHGLVARLKNAILGLQAGGKFEFLMEKIAKLSTIPAHEKGKGNELFYF